MGVLLEASLETTTPSRAPENCAVLTALALFSMRRCRCTLMSNFEPGAKEFSSELQQITTSLMILLSQDSASLFVASGLAAEAAIQALRNDCQKDA